MTKAFVFGSVRARRVTLALAVALLFCISGGTGGSTFAATTVGVEAAVGLPTSAQYNLLVNFRPGDGEVVHVNPPRFSWFYTPNPRNNFQDYIPKEFILLVSTNPACDGGFQVQVTNQVNCYNFLSPLAKGTTYYWKIGYIYPANLSDSTTWAVPGLATWAATPYAWSAIRSFTIADDAVTWDRHFLADSSYLTSKAGHPHLLFNAANLPAVRQWVQTNAASAAAWSAIQATADSTIAASWWPSQAPPPIKVITWAVDIGNVAFAWQMTQNPAYGQNLGAALTNLTQFYLTNTLVCNSAPAGYMMDDVSCDDMKWVERALAFGYDWGYDIMTPAQRTFVLSALEQRSAYALRGAGGWFNYLGNGGHYSGGDITGAYTNAGNQVLYASQAYRGTSHWGDNWNYSAIMALAGFGDGPRCLDYLNYYLNFHIGVTFSFGFEGEVNEGRIYGAQDLFDFNAILDKAILADTVFPEMSFNKNPFWKTNAQWWALSCPVMFNEYMGGFADTDSGVFPFWQRPTMGRDLGCFLNDGNTYQHFLNATAAFSGRGQSTNFDKILIPFLYPAPVPTVNTNTAGAFLAGGWTMSWSGPPNVASTFTNGVGFVFQARPRGYGLSHDYYSDMSFQISAYGAAVTDAGAYYPSKYAKSAMGHNAIQVNGFGPCQPFQANGGPLYPAYCKIIAYTNCADFTYCAADGTLAYPSTQFNAEGILSAQATALYSTAPTKGLTGMQRHILFNRKKYFVIYDTMKSTNNLTYSWLYHIVQPTLNLDQANMRFNYTATNFYSGASVPVYVAHVANIDRLTLVDQTGTNIQRNPITGEAYDEKPKRSHDLWFQSPPTNNFHFMTVIYPVPPGSPAPTIERLDDDTVSVVNGAENDVISFASQPPAGTTLAINLAGVTSANTNLVLVYTNTLPAGFGGATSSAAAAAPPKKVPPAGLYVVTQYSPDKIPAGYSVWWNPDSLIAGPGTAIGTWTDSTSSARAAVQADATRRPTLGSKNGHNILTFDGTNDCLVWANSAVLPQPFEVFVVLRPNAIGAQMEAFSSQAPPYVLCSFIGGNYGYGEFAGSYLLNTKGRTTDWKVATYQFNGTNSQVFVNSTLVGSGATGSNGLAGAVVGAFQTQTQHFWNGDIGDILIYPKILTPDMQKKVEDTLRSKYGF
jgi:hypothetical protein